MVHILTQTRYLECVNHIALKYINKLTKTTLKQLYLLRNDTLLPINCLPKRGIIKLGINYKGGKNVNVSRTLLL
jgi:hypothetical protein